MDSKKDGKVASIVREASSSFFERESNRTSMITVTRTEVKNKGKNVLIFVSIFPEEKESDAIIFLKRKRSELRDFLKEKTGLSLIPFVDIEIDQGEKNRQKLDTLKI